MIDELKKLLKEFSKLEGPWESRHEYGSDGRDLKWLPVATLCDGRFFWGLLLVGFGLDQQTPLFRRSGKKSSACFFCLC